MNGGTGITAWKELSQAEVRRAVAIYLNHAYGEAPPPAAVRSKLNVLNATDAPSLVDCPIFERAGASASKLSLRLGNRFYPHMKLVIEPSPDGARVLFRADTHDKHCAPKPDSTEYYAFLQLMEQNQAVAQAIETAWAEAGVTTFKTFLRDDLARRRAARPVP